MTEPISIERWQQAQRAERSLHKMGFNEGIGHYFWSYRNYFRCLGIEQDQKGKSIIEIGPADVPALMFCYNYQGAIIEPMPSTFLHETARRLNISVLSRPVEQMVELPKANEIWLLNIMQHVIDPELFIIKCKQAAKCIRFFEPINQPTCEHHPHTFSADDLARWYGADTIKQYNDKLPGFFDDICVYGVWENKDI